MEKKNERRSSTLGTGSDRAHQAELFERVGGRQAPAPSPAGGGGYQNICTVLNFDASAAEKKRDPRLEELRQMGLQRIWCEVAEVIGVDALLKMWRILDSDPESIGDNGRLILPLCRYNTFLRYQRNRYIETLAEMGEKPRDIQRILKAQLCEEISLRHISRISNQD